MINALGLKLIAWVVLLAALVGGYKWHAHSLRDEGRAEVQAKWDKANAASAEAAQAQADRNRELQRASELRYTVLAETRDRFITQTITEVRHESQSLAVCPVPDRARQLLNRAAACASSDTAAACSIN